jgi:hypothetical protein
MEVFFKRFPKIGFLRDHQVFDGDGLFLDVKPNGRKLWRFQKQIGNKVIRRSLGRYPLASLK